MVNSSQHSTEEHKASLAKQSAEESLLPEQPTPNIGSVAFIGTPGANQTREIHGKNSKRKKPALSSEEAAEKRKRIVYRWKIIIGLSGPFILQSFNSTILASAYPYIATDFDEIKQLNWIISVFNLTSATFLPLWTQLTDIFGRYHTIQASILVLMVGLAICTSAPTSAFGFFLFGRALAGLGDAGINISIRTILADRVSLPEYAINWTILSLIAGTSFGVGPLIGGYLTQISWRWCFALSIPIAVISLLLVFFLLRKELLGPQPLPELERRNISSRRGRLLARLSTIDYGGQTLFLFGVGLLLLALTWGGGIYPWNSAAVIAPLVWGGILTLVWILYERSMSPGRPMSRIFPLQRGMIAWALLSQRDIGILFVINFSDGVVMSSILNFMGFYFSLVEGRSSSESGLSLLYYMPGLAVGAYMAILSSNVWPRQTFPALLLGGVTSAISMTVMAWAVHGGRTSVVYGMMALAGHSIMIRMNPASMHALAYFPAMTAPILCLQTFAISFGSLVGITVMSTTFINQSGIDQGDPRNGVMWAFIALIPFVWFNLLLTGFLGNVWILKYDGHELVQKPYLWSLVTRRKLLKERKDHGQGLEHGVSQA